MAPAQQPREGTNSSFKTYRYTLTCRMYVLNRNQVAIWGFQRNSHPVKYLHREGVNVPCGWVRLLSRLSISTMLTHAGINPGQRRCMYEYCVIFLSCNSAARYVDTYSVLVRSGISIVGPPPGCFSPGTGCTPGKLPKGFLHVETLPRDLLVHIPYVDVGEFHPLSIRLKYCSFSTWLSILSFLLHSS